jgi:dihydroxyacetone kinase-like protein
MKRTHLDLQETKEMFVFLSKKMIDSKDILTQADKAIGDGDHGIGMAKGFEAVIVKIDKKEFYSLDELFKAIGFALMTSIGGASGAIFGTLFQCAAPHLKEKAFLMPKRFLTF